VQHKHSFWSLLGFSSSEKTFSSDRWQQSALVHVDGTKVISQRTSLKNYASLENRDERKKAIIRFGSLSDCF